MRILVASDQWFPDFHGGSARVATDVSRMLAERGHDIVALVPENDGGPEESNEGRLRVRRVLRRTQLPQTFTDILQTRRHSRRVGGPPFDVLVAHHPTTAVGLIRAGLGVPLVLVFHASAPRETRFLRSRLPRRRERLATYGLAPALGWLEQAAVRSARRILVLSEYSRNLVTADHPESEPIVRTVQGGVDIERFAPRADLRAAKAELDVRTDRPLLFTVRRLDPRMGVDHLLHAVKRLVSERDVSLVVAGSGLLQRELAQLAHDLGLDGHVSFVGPVSDAELQRWYSAADLFVLPTVAYEGFGMVSVEALSSGTPVVGTPVGATPEVLAGLDPRLVASDATPEGLAAVIEQALSFAGPAFRRECREYASERFAWRKTILPWEECLREAVANDGAT